MSLHPADLSSLVRRLVRRAVCERFGHTWHFAPYSLYCRACRISGHDAYRSRRRRTHGFAG
jgi:hypothetical protein